MTPETSRDWESRANHSIHLMPMPLHRVVSCALSGVYETGESSLHHRSGTSPDQRVDSKDSLYVRIYLATESSQ
jgi:hypothetical protein